MPKYPEINWISHRHPLHHMFRPIVPCNLSPQPAGAWDVRVASSPGPRSLRGAQYRCF